MMRGSGALVLTLFVLISTIAGPISAAGTGPPSASSEDEPIRAGGEPTADVAPIRSGGGPTADVAPIDRGPDESPLASPTASIAVQDDDRPTDPSTEETIGYVEGYWYDDELPVDDRENATLAEDELEAVVYRSMARVEVVREKPFRDEVDVEVITRQEFANETEAQFEAIDDSERLHQNVRFEALFMVDRETDAVDEFAALYGGAVAGYYDPAADRIAIVSNDPENARMNEVTLGHELMHAMQDQYHGLEGLERDTRDGENARNGLVEGEASLIDAEYERQCEAEWDCVLPGEEEAGDQPLPNNWGMYFTIFQPYSDGPTFVEHLRDEGGWEAVDAAYDDVPRASSEIIRPEEYGEYDDVEVETEDTSSDDWQRLEIENGPDYSRFGEATMASMLIAPTWESRGQVSIVDENDVLTGDDRDPIEYDHEYTDGWAGDRLETYVTDAEEIEESGYVWRTEWQSEDDAAQFVDGYVQLLEFRNADPVDDHRDTFVIDAEFPGAYYVDHDGETVTIVRAPTVEELPEIRDGAAPEGEDTIEGDVAWYQDEDDPAEGNESEDGAEPGDGNASDDGNESDADQGDPKDDRDVDRGDDEIPGFGPVAALVAALAGAALLVRRR